MGYVLQNLIMHIKSTGLAKVVSEICEPGNFNELHSPLVIATYRLYCWREALGALLSLWTPTSIKTKFPSEVFAFFKVLQSSNVKLPSGLR